MRSVQVGVKVKVLVSHLSSTLYNPTDRSPPGSSVHGILQARTLESVAMPASRGSSRPRDRARISRIAGRPQCGRALVTFFSRCRSPVTRLWCSFPALLPVDVWGISSLRMCGEGCVAMHVLGEQTHTSVSPEYLRGESQSAPTVGNTRRLCKAVTPART